MNQDPNKRRLTAIFSTDVVGYSRLMEADEGWTIQSLEENKKLLGSMIEGHNGRVVDAPGDNMLAEFSSVINAVECAVKVQEALNKKNSNLIEDRRMLFRIGVNLGDVVAEDDRIYGNGVNIAARLEGLAEAGGICISHTAYDQVKNKIDVDYDYLGEYQVKNLSEPVKAYRILLKGVTTDKYVPNGKSHKIFNPLSITVAILLLLVIVLGTTVVLLYPKLSKPPQIIRFVYELPEDQQFSSSDPQILLAVSPDGHQFVYGTKTGLYARSVNKLDSSQITRTDENPKHPFFSPDGQWIGYWTKDNQLKKISIKGGNPVLLCNTDNAAGADWQADNTIIYSDLKGIWRISADGGSPELLIPAKNDIILFPQLLHDGKSLMFSRYASDKFVVTVHSLESGERKELFAGVISRYLPTGHIVFIDDNIICAIGFNPDTHETVGGKVPLEEIVFRKTGVPQYAVSDSGTLVYIPETKSEIFSDTTMVWVNKEGVEESVGADTGVYFHPRISPDGTRVASSVMDDEHNDYIRIWDFARKTMTNLTSNEIDAYHPFWAPDGKSIVFAYNNKKEGRFSVGRIASNGTGAIEEFFSSSFTATFPDSWVENGKSIILTETPALFPPKTDIAVLTIDEDPSLTPLLQQEKWNEYQPQISPDKRWMAYTCNESGEDEIYLRPFPSVEEGKIKISTDGGNSPLWSPDGMELFYRKNDEVMAVAVGTDPINNPGKPQSLFKGEYVSAFFNPAASEVHPWDISPDGSRFLMLKHSTSTAVDFRTINIVLNWDEELKKKVPVD